MVNIDEHIQKAIQDGKFDDLPGMGKSLGVEINANDDPEWRLAYHLLRSSGYSLPWIETRKDILTALDLARQSLIRTWLWRQQAIAEERPSDEIELEWQRAQQAFHNQITALNQRIRTYNLAIPHEQFQLLLPNSDHEIASLTTKASAQ
jgi:hypothetical protein